MFTDLLGLLYVCGRGFEEYRKIPLFEKGALCSLQIHCTHPEILFGESREECTVSLQGPDTLLQGMHCLTLTKLENSNNNYSKIKTVKGVCVTSQALKEFEQKRHFHCTESAAP